MDHWEPSNNYESNHQMNLQIDNPLTRITLDQPIHELITFHLMQRHVSPFKIDNAASLSAKIFYTSFVFGLLTFIDSKPGPKTTVMYQWKLNDTLEIMAAYNKTLDNVVLYIHEINFARVFRGSSVFRQQHPNYNRLAALKSYVESELRSTLSIQTITVYKYEMFAQRVNGSPQIGFGMTMNDHQIFSGDIVTTNNFSWDKFKLITPSGNDKYDPLLVQFVQQVSIVHELDDQLQEAFASRQSLSEMGDNNIMEGMIRQVKANEAAALRAAKQFPNIDRFLVSAATQINDDQSLSYFDDNTIDLTVTQTFNSNDVVEDRKLGEKSNQRVDDKWKRCSIQLGYGVYDAYVENDEDIG
uniref:Uncharacterized protein n=1 Tax=Romanomermis culicivorax TaxID=13658 RepID=A0A915HNT9_ROMCU